MDHAITPDIEALLVTLADVPMITVEVVRQVIDAWQTTRAPIVRPAIGSTHGHPVLYDRSLFPALRSAPLEQGAKAVVRARESDILNVPVSDPGCLRDVDTPDDYSKLL
jgi:molybdenum cofactor cytidylyltransferase